MSSRYRFLDDISVVGLADIQWNTDRSGTGECIAGETSQFIIEIQCRRLALHSIDMKVVQNIKCERSRGPVNGSGE